MRTMMTLMVVCLGIGVGWADDDRHRPCPVVRCSDATITVTCPPLPAPVCTCSCPSAPVEPRCKRCRQLPNGEFLCHGCSLVVPARATVP